VGPTPAVGRGARDPLARGSCGQRRYPEAHTPVPEVLGGGLGWGLGVALESRAIVWRMSLAVTPSRPIASFPHRRSLMAGLFKQVDPWGSWGFAWPVESGARHRHALDPIAAERRSEHRRLALIDDHPHTRLLCANRHDALGAEPLRAVSVCDDSPLSLARSDRLEEARGKPGLRIVDAAAPSRR